MAFSLGDLICCFLGFLLGGAALSKLREGKKFEGIFREYLPAWAMRYGSARYVAWTEFCLGASLLCLKSPTLVYGLGGSLLFFTLVAFVVTARWIGGEKRFRCGCGGDLGEEHLAWFILLRGLLMICGIAYVLMHAEDVHAVSTSVAPAYLYGFTLVIGLKMTDATFHAWSWGNQWKVVG